MPVKEGDVATEYSWLALSVIDNLSAPKEETKLKGLFKVLDEIYLE